MHEQDRILAPLFRDGDADTRLAVLRQLVTYWHGPPGKNDETSPVDLPMPLVLREWYRWAGPNSPILDGHNNFFSCEPVVEAHRLSVSDGLLAFQSENQGCYFWATEPRGDDPPVYGRASSGEPWVLEGSVLSEHLIASFIVETFADPDLFTGFAALIDNETIEAMSTIVSPLPIAPWHWPTWPARFYAGNGMLMMVVGDVGMQGIYVTAKEAGSLRPLAICRPSTGITALSDSMRSGHRLCRSRGAGIVFRRIQVCRARAIVAISVRVTLHSRCTTLAAMV